MAGRENYQIQMEQIIKKEVGQVPKLLLHACCAPCSSACLERVVPYFDVTVYYYNPNITEETEYRKRVEEEKRLIAEMNLPRSVSFMEGDYDAKLFFETVRGLEKEPEGGARCVECFQLRLANSAQVAEENGFDYVTTTLTISPLKNADTLNRIGRKAVEGKRVMWLPSDFKKKNGYKRSIELSAEHDLYRQNYCGCVFSKVQSMKYALHFQDLGVN